MIRTVVGGGLLEPKDRKVIPMSKANPALDETNNTNDVCVRCHRKADSGDKLTWLMFREDHVLRDMAEVKTFLEKGVGRPYIVTLPGDGGVHVYFGAWYCNSCCDTRLKEFEKHNTLSDQTTKTELENRVVKRALDSGWTTYSLQLGHLAPRGFPHMALIKGERLVLPSLVGSVAIRLRAFRAPPNTMLMSPEVPKEVREGLSCGYEKEQLPSTVSFLHMDEKYIDVLAPPEIQVTSLTGLLITADTYPLFRDRAFGLLPGFTGEEQSIDIDVHASNLFRDFPDEEHYAFYGKLVSLVKELDCKVYRRGFNFTPGHELLRKKEKYLLQPLFRSMLIAVEDFNHDSQIWPVMEIDHSEEQDRMFAGYMRRTDHVTAYLQMIGDGVEELIDDDHMVDNTRIGDLHYVSKKSVVGCAVDCLAYLLHCKWLYDRGFQLTDYKTHLAHIASRISPSLVDDFVGNYRAV